MRFEAIQIRGSNKYNFIILTRDKPDSELKERIRAQIREAMEALGRKEESYSVSILEDDRAEEPGDIGYPELKPGANYLLFAFRSDRDSAEYPSPRAFEEEREELAKGIFKPSGSRVALVLLYDSRLQAIITEGRQRSVLMVGSVSKRSGKVTRRIW